MGIRLSSLALAATAAAARFVENDATVISNCYAVNGNGFAWAASLSYLSEALDVQAKQARDEETASGKKVYVHQACITGGSSGAAVVGVWQNLLKNPDLVDPNGTFVQGVEVNNVTLGDVRVYSPGELETLATAMRFVAMGVDANIPELGQFLPGYALELLIGKVLNDQGKLVDAVPNKPNWWKQTNDPYKAQVLFVQKALVARNVRPADWATPLRTAIYEAPGNFFDFESFDTEKLVDIASKNGVQGPTGILLDNSDVADVDKMEVLRRLGQWARDAGNQVNERAYFEQSSTTRWGQRIERDASINTDSTLNTMLKEDLDNGFCTMTFSVLYDDQAALDAVTNADGESTKPTYEQARPVLACSEETINVILNSEAYQRDLLKEENSPPDSDAPISRFVLVALGTYYEALNYGIREPKLFRILAGEMQQLGMTKFYDPKKDFEANSVPQFQLVDTNGANGGKKPAIAVLGGYPSSQIMSVIQSYYTRSLFQGLKDKVSGGKVLARHNHFRKGGAPPTFALEVIEEILSDGDEALATTNKAAYDEFIAVYDKKVPDEFKSLSDDDNEIVSLPTKVDWTLTGQTNPLPAALATTSFMLAPRGVGQTRSSLDAARTYTGQVYVPGQEAIVQYEIAQARTDKEPIENPTQNDATSIAVSSVVVMFASVFSLAL
jgi:hypothetical protein